MTRKVILLLSVITLFLLSMAKTVSLLGIKPTDTNIANTGNNQNNETELAEYEDNFNNNSFQGDDTGVFLFDGEKVYYNTVNYVIAYDVYSGSKEPLVAGMQIKCMTNAGDYLYGATTMPNGNGIDMDYIVRIKKSDGNVTVFYKTECSHITSVAYDGTTAYYTNESHAIYKTDSEYKEEWVYTKQNADYPYIIGIFNGFAYISDGTKIEKISLDTGIVETVSSKLCSVNQKPIMHDGKIYMLGNFNGDSICCLDMSTGEIEEIVKSSYINLVARAEKIDSFSASNGYLYFSCNNTLYFKDIVENKNPRCHKYTGCPLSGSFGNCVFYMENDEIIIADIT